MFLSPNRKSSISAANCVAKAPGVISSEPHSKSLVVLRYPREFNDMPPKSQ